MVRPGRVARILCKVRGELPRPRRPEFRRYQNPIKSQWLYYKQRQQCSGDSHNRGLLDQTQPPGEMDIFIRIDHEVSIRRKPNHRTDRRQTRFASINSSQESRCQTRRHVCWRRVLPASTVAGSPSPGNGVTLTDRTRPSVRPPNGMPASFALCVSETSAIAGRATGGGKFFPLRFWRRRVNGCRRVRCNFRRASSTGRKAVAACWTRTSHCMHFWVGWPSGRTSRKALGGCSALCNSRCQIISRLGRIIPPGKGAFSTS